MDKNKILAGFLIFAGVLLVSAFLHISGMLSGLQMTLSHSLYDGRELNDEIVIVGIDEKSMSTPEEGGLSSFGDWNKSYYAQVLDQIEAGEPSVVFFDLLFASEASGLTSMELLQIATEYPQVNDFVLETLSYAGSPHPYDTTFIETLAKYDNVYLIKSGAGELTFDGDAFSYEAEIAPLDMFGSEAKAGFANVIDTEDGSNSSTIYAIPMKISVDGVMEDHVDFQLVQDHLNVESLDVPLEDGQMYINYAQPSYSYPMASFSDVFYGFTDASEFTGKIVLIGGTASILQDRHFTPIDEDRPMSGIEIHANAVQTVLDEAYLLNQGLAGFLGVVGVMVLLLIAVSLFAPIWAGAAVLAAEVILFPFYAQFVFNRGSIPDLIWPVFAIVTAYLAALAYRNFTEFRDKRKMKSAFGHYVSPELVEQISANPELLKLGGERRDITVMFLDIENFTPLAESLQPTEVVNLVNTYFGALAEVIIEHGGTVDKFEGDAIMVLFGAPVASEDHGLKACETALAIRAKMEELNTKMKQKLAVRIGISSGAAIVGNMGSVDRFDYTAMGDTVNTASRLESGNKFYGTRVLVNSGAMEVAQSKIVFRRVDRVRLKGKAEAIDIYEIMGPAEGVSAEGKTVLETWHQALEYYRNQNWAEAETRLREVLKAMPEDGPVKAYLARIEWLKKNPKQGWDGTWEMKAK